MSANPPVQTTPPRSLADQLRGWSDDRLAHLLRARPDLATPAPTDSTHLASRAATRASLLRALDQLTLVELHVLDALVLGIQNPELPPGETVHAAPEAIDAAIERLRGLALVWDSPEGVRPLSGVADALGASASGLTPFTPGAAPADVSAAAARIERASPATLALLRHLDESGGTGLSDRTRPADPAQARHPVEEALALDLLRPREGGRVVLPGEVAMALRGGRTTAEPVGTPEPLATSPRDRALIDKVAAGAAAECVRRTEALLQAWGNTPPRVLRSGGVAVKDLRAAAVLLHCSEASTALVIELAAAAGLLTSTDHTGQGSCWVPTHAYDGWRERPTGERWARLVAAWWKTERIPSLAVDSTDGTRVGNVLGPEATSPAAPELRHAVLEALAAIEPGHTLAAGTGVASLVAYLEWSRPRHSTRRTPWVARVLEEAADLGVTGLGGISSPGRALLGPDGPDGTDSADSAAQVLERLLPPPVSTVLVQADLTAVAPGPLTVDVGRRLGQLADVESSGGATVHRFSAASIRRGYEAGWTAGEVHAFLDEIADTGVPQPLTYLVDDVARTFGRLRVGLAEAFLRVDAAEDLAGLVDTPAATALGLRRIAPTVLISTQPVEELVEGLGERGFAVVAEDETGVVRLAGRQEIRGRTPRQAPATAYRAARETAHVAQVVGAVRAGDRAAASRPARPREDLSPSAALAALREAVEARARVVITYVDNHGTRGERLLDPVRVEGGHLTAYDHQADDTRSFAVHRVASVRPAEAG